MSFFDQAYDEMSWQEICYRLPSELAVNALSRRINNLETLKMFFDNVGTQPSGITELKKHVNTIIDIEDPTDILDMFGENYERVLFTWMNDNNKKRVKDQDPSKLSTKFLFNTTDADDRDGLRVILDRILSEADINQSQLRSVLSKANSKHFNSLIDTVIRDSRPEVRVNVLSIGSLTNKSLLSDLQKVIGLKALAQCSSKNPVSAMSVLNIDVFASLRPLERLDALEKYLSYFPRFRKIAAFDPVPSKDEFDMILFAGCIEHNERITKLNDAYTEITELDPPDQDNNEEDVP